MAISTWLVIYLGKLTANIIDEFLTRLIGFYSLSRNCLDQFMIPILLYKNISDVVILFFHGNHG